MSEVAWVDVSVLEETSKDLRRISVSRGVEMLLNPTRAPLVSSSFTVACVTAIALVAGSSCLAQVAGGTFSGSVRDSSGRAIAGAEVAVKNFATGILRSVNADNDGIYTAPNLVPGTYEISASKEGFETIVRSGVFVTVGSEQIIDFKLNPGEIKTKIEVSGTSPDIQLAGSTLEATENSTTVRELPLNGRDWTSLVLLQPGVTGVNQYPLGLNSLRANRGLGTQLTIGGTRPQGNNYRLDGISINDYSNGGPAAFSVSCSAWRRFRNFLS